MKRILLFMTLFASLAAPAWALNGGIQGLVLNAQGGPVRGATVTVTAKDQGPLAKVVTSEDGSYDISNLEPGVYTLTVSGVNTQQVLQMDVVVDSETVSTHADFRFTADAAQELAGLEERNPNIFIYRIDLNDLRNLLTLFRGPNPTYVPAFLAENNYFGAEYGTPLLSFQPLRPRPLLTDWRASLSPTHPNSALNARNFFYLGPLLSFPIPKYQLPAGGPPHSSQTSLLLDFGQIFNSGMVNGNVQAPLASERTPRAADAQTNAIISNLLRAYPAQLPNLPAVSLRQLNTNAARSIVTADGLARLDVKPDEKTSIAGFYSVNQYSEDPFQLVIGQNPQTDLRNQSAYIELNRIFSPQSAGQFGFHFDRIRASLLPTHEFDSLLAPLGFTAVPEIVTQDLAEIGPGIQFPRMRAENRFKVFSNLTRTIGRHTVKFGWSTARAQVNDLQSNNNRGVLNFNSDFGRTAVENF